MGKIKIKKSELDRIIKEEALKFKKALTLKRELANVQKELKQLNEVEGGEDIEPTGGKNLTNSKKQFVDVSQKAPKFHNPSKNPHTMMEDEEEIEDVDIDSEDNLDTDGDTIDKAAVLSAIEDLKMALNLHGDSEEDETNGEEVGDEDEEFEFDSENDGTEEHESEESEEEETEEHQEGGEEEGEEEDTEEIEEGGYDEAHQDPKTGEVHQTVQKESEEGTLMESERKRMAILAGIMKG
jgi:hypothetical protein